MKCQLLIIFAVLINFSILEDTEDNWIDTTQIEGEKSDVIHHNSI